MVKRKRNKGNFWTGDSKPTGKFRNILLLTGLSNIDDLQPSTDQVLGNARTSGESLWSRKWWTWSMATPLLKAVLKKSSMRFLNLLAQISFLLSLSCYFYPAWSSSDRAWFSAKIKSIHYCTPGKTPPPHPLPIGRTSGTASPLPGKSSATYKYDFYKMYPEN